MAKSDEHAATDSFGAHLARLRSTAKLSLREVEEATNKEVSNAYLSQLENNKITKPSPNILHALSVVYKTPYEDLMRRAGYVSTGDSASSSRQPRVATFAVQGLTPDEERALLEYLAFIRQPKRK
jgi:HTH-type transcriptional regulator, competence development regulator